MKRTESDWTKRLEKRPFRDLQFTTGMWDQVEERLHAAKQKRNRRIQRRLAGGGLAVVALFMIAAVTLWADPSLQARLFGRFDQGRSPIVDTSTPEMLPLLQEAEPSMFIHEISDDGMAWSYSAETPFVIDPDYYAAHAVSRGDIIYYKRKVSKAETGPGGRYAYSVMRVIGMPGERVQIRKNQIYIDSYKLEAFYGNGTRGRQDIQLNEAQSALADDVQLGEGEYYLLGDIWWRSGDYGVFSLSELAGKAVGYVEKQPETAASWVKQYHEGDFVIYAEEGAEAGMYRRYEVAWRDMAKNFDWRGTDNPSYTPQVMMADVDHDKTAEAVIVMVTGYGTGVYEKEVHVVRENLTEIPVADPVDAAQKAVTKAQVRAEGERVVAELAIGGQTLSEEYAADDAELWFEEPGIGSIIEFRMDEEGYLTADLSVFASPGMYMADVSVRYDWKDGELIPVRFAITDRS